MTLPEVTPVHEAAQPQNALRRVGIESFEWVINQSFAAAGTPDPMWKIRSSCKASSSIENSRRPEGKKPAIECPGY